MKGFLFLLMLWDWADIGSYAQDAIHEQEEEKAYEVFYREPPPSFQVETP